MIAKCANPSCVASFRYLHEGKVFKLEVGQPGDATKAKLPHRIEHFWLCSDCVRSLTLVLHEGKVSTRPLCRLLVESSLAEAIHA